MTNLWTDKEAKNYTTDLELRVFTSNLLGRSDELVLHGGGNTSVKSVVNDQNILFVKGSGWDLVSIKKEGFAPVELTMLQDMAKVEELSDSEMVAAQREAIIDSSAPNPSVEAILHAIIPFKFVDHTHADAVVTISNNVNGIENIKKVYPNFLIVPYVMPGFILAHTIYKMTKDLDWSTCEGIILHNHGIFTFDDDAKRSYDKMIQAVTKAEEFLNENAFLDLPVVESKFFNIGELETIMKIEKEGSLSCVVNQSQLALNYASLDSKMLTRGVLTPEHIIRTKRVPLVLKIGDSIVDKLQEYKKSYVAYFEQFNTDKIMLNPSPNYAVIEGFGVVSFGKNEKEAKIINDIIEHTMKAVLRSDILGGYESISLLKSFEMEYWELEQAKLKK